MRSIDDPHVRPLDVRVAAGATRAGPVAADDGARTGGQMVILIERWVLIGAAVLITLWSPQERDLNAVKATILCLFGLAAANFFLHAQLLVGKPARSSVVYASSAVDIGVITAIIAAFGGGIGNPIFVFYYPALLAVGLVFPPRVACAFTVGLLGLYAVVGLPSAIHVVDAQIFVARIVSLAAIGAIGCTYQLVEQRRLERGRDDALLLGA